MRTSLEVADVFRAAGPAYRTSHSGHLSLQQLKIMSAIEHCRTSALGGHVEACIRHYGLLAGSTRKTHLDHARQLLAVAAPAANEAPADQPDPRPPCPCCGGRMVVIETFQRCHPPRGPPSAIAPSGNPAP